MENIRIKLIVDDDTKAAKKGLDDLTEAEKKAKIEFEKLAKAGKDAGKAGADGAKQAKNEYDKLNQTISKLGSVIAGVFTVQALVSFTKEVVNVRSEFEKFEAVLANTLGSSNAAELAMKRIQSLAATTPFSVRELTEAFVQLANRGVQPTNDQLRAVADVAAATGKPIDLLLGAVVDATDTMRWRNLGISVEKVGDKMIGTFKGMKVEVEGNTKGALEMVEAFGKMQGVAGATKAVSKTLEGRLSNLGDTWDRLLNNIGKNTSSVFGNIIGIFSDLVDSINEGIEATSEMDRIFGMNTRDLGKNFKDLFDEISATRVALSETAKSASDYNQQILKLVDAKKELNTKTAEGYVKSRIYTDAIIQLSKDKEDYINKTKKEAEAQRQLALEKQKAIDQANAEKGAYSLLNKQIGALNKIILDNITLTKIANGEDVKQLVLLQERLRVINETLDKEKAYQIARMNPITVQMESKSLGLAKDKNAEQKKFEDGQKRMAKTEEYNNNILKTNQREIENFYQREREHKEYMVALQMEAISIAGNLSQALFNANIAQIQAESNERIKALDNEKNVRLNNERITAEQRKLYEGEYEREREAILREAFEQEKKYKKMQAIINGALAITQILASTPDPTGTLTALRIANAIVTTGAQVATIEAQKYEKGGWIKGKLHKEGGTIIEAEKDEFVVNRRVAPQNKALLESINNGRGMQFIRDNYVLPAVIKHTLSNAHTDALTGSIYDDRYLRKTLKETSAMSAKYIVKGLKNNNRPSRYV
jgi:hypothetical protein